MLTCIFYYLLLFVSMPVYRKRVATAKHKSRPQWIFTCQTLSLRLRVKDFLGISQSENIKQTQNVFVFDKIHKQFPVVRKKNSTDMKTGSKNTIICHCFYVNLSHEIYLEKLGVCWHENNQQLLSQIRGFFVSSLCFSVPDDSVVHRELH